MSSETEEAIAFLRKFHGADSWVLTAIDPEKKGSIVTRTFTSVAWSAAKDFIDAHDGKRNVYFLPASITGMLNKKPSKDDIAHTRWLWVDIDPRAGEDLDEERVRILELLTTNLPEIVPGPPTLVVDSGRGYWGFWRLTEPARLEAEDYMRALEIEFRADSCHNIDRIARLPGTVNLKTGRRACIV